MNYKVEIKQNKVDKQTFIPQHKGGNLPEGVAKKNADVSDIKNVLRAAKKYLNVRFRDITEAITFSNGEWSCTVCFTEGYKGFGVASNDWRFPSNTTFSIFTYNSELCMELHEGEIGECIKWFLKGK